MEEKKFKNFLRKFIREQVGNITNGKVIAYHGTPHGKFEKFSMRHRGKGADVTSVGDYGKGFYFTPDKEEAIAYATHLAKDIKTGGNKPVLYTVELTMKKPFSFDKLHNFNNDLMAFVKKKGGNLLTPLSDEEYEFLYKKHNTSEEELDFMNDLEGLINDNWGDWDIAGKLKAHGYDSMISPNNEFIVYKPSQIKILNTEEL